MNDTNGKIAEPSTLALQALGWILAEEVRASRLLALTGLSPDILRGALHEPITQAAILGFLESHEPDLIACADAIGAKPGALIAAKRELEA